MTTHEIPKEWNSIIPVKPARSISECGTIEVVPKSLLSNIFFIRKKEYSVHLYAGKLVWERSKSRNDRNLISVENILAIKPQFSKSASVSKPRNADANFETEIPSKNERFEGITIIYAKRMENSSNSNKWRHFSQTFQSNDKQVCMLWIQTLQQQINGKI